MTQLNWFDYLMFFSFAASLVGLTLLLISDPEEFSEAERTERLLFKLVFACWLIYCICFRIQRAEMISEPVSLLAIRGTAVVSYLLTFSSILALPLHHIAISVRQPE